MPSDVNFKYKNFFYVLGTVTSLEASPGQSNIIKLKNTISVTITLTFEATNVTSYEFLAHLDTGYALDTSFVVIDNYNMSINYVMSSAILSEISYGTYTIYFNLTGDSESSIAKEMILHYEEEISGLKVLVLLNI